MRNKDAFSGYHPTINFLYFALVLLFSMCLMHPVYLAISLTGALAYDIYLKGRKAARFAVMGLLPMAVFAALVNPAFNHEGATILTYLPSGNPLTLESMLYGAAAAVMLASVVLWFSSYNEVMTSDKFVYLFGRVIPALSLVLSMSLRFIPKFKAQMQTVSEAQACIGRDTKNGSVLRRVGNAVKIFSILVTWSLENAIETADSMRSRGYGLPGRTAFSIYRFDDRDKAALAWLIFCGAYLISGWMAGGTYQRTLRSRRMKASGLEDIPGIGEKRRQALLKKFRSVKAISQAGQAELEQVLPVPAAQAVYRHFHPQEGGTACASSQEPPEASR